MQIAYPTFALHSPIAVMRSWNSFVKEPVFFFAAIVALSEKLRTRKGEYTESNIQNLFVPCHASSSGMAEHVFLNSGHNHCDND